MNQYQNQYGTVYAVRDCKGAPQIMCRAKDDGDRLVSGTLAVQAAAAKTADEMQAVLDQHATAHGWQPVDEQAPASAEPPEIVDEGSGAEAGFPDWVRPMVEAFLRFPFFRELPAFTAFALRHSEPVQHRQGGSLADGLYDTDSKGIKFSVFRGNNSDHYREASYTWGDFVRRCKAAGLAPEQLHQDKEDAPCNTETPAPTGAAAATTGVSAAPEPSKTAETTATSESGADAGTSMSQESGTSGPSTLPARGCPAGTGDAAQGNSESAPLTTPPSGSSAFDYTGLNVVTVDTLHLAENIIRSARQWLRNPSIKYACKLDIRHCYESVDRGRLMGFLRRHIKNDDLLWLIQTLIDTFDKGLSIGSYLSQYLCNLYLSELYHEIAENMYKLRGRKRGGKRVNLVRHVLFYMDDILLLGTSAKDMNAAAKRVITKAAAMGLEIKPDWRVFRIADAKGGRGSFIDMMGFRFYRKYTTIRSRVFLRLRRAFLRAQRRRTLSLRAAQRCIAYFGFVLHTSSFTIAHRYKVYKAIKKAKEVISRESKISRSAAAGAIG